jgi:hypothetical protein
VPKASTLPEALIKENKQNAASEIALTVDISYW